jgi:hypothetical protein
LRELFVWYQVRDDRAAAALASVRALQRSLMAAWPGLQARILIRREVAGMQTWMETYARDAGSATDGKGIDGELEAAIEAAAGRLGDAIAGARHAEAFDVVALP